jgi:hypothetical protein
MGCGDDYMLSLERNEVIPELQAKLKALEEENVRLKEENERLGEENARLRIADSTARTKPTAYIIKDEGHLERRDQSLHQKDEDILVRSSRPTAFGSAIDIKQWGKQSDRTAGSPVKQYSRYSNSPSTSTLLNALSQRPAYEYRKRPAGSLIATELSPTARRTAKKSRPDPTSPLALGAPPAPTPTYEGLKIVGLAGAFGDPMSTGRSIPYHNPISPTVARMVQYQCPFWDHKLSITGTVHRNAAITCLAAKAARKRRDYPLHSNSEPNGDYACLECSKARQSCTRLALRCPDCKELVVLPLPDAIRRGGPLDDTYWVI